ncbi:hypothetical protein, partial [Staphylococcus capitis]|uniref:hypothetical protein n=1 Tax=Staphylococcus capitis TaxID=29388 RepID=UPI001C92D8BB
LVGVNGVYTTATILAVLLGLVKIGVRGKTLRMINDGGGEDSIGGISKTVKLGGIGMIGLGMIKVNNVDNKSGGRGNGLVNLSKMGGEIGNVNG